MNRRSPAVAALLSFLWPGAGHVYLGRRRTAIVFAAPLALVTLALGLKLLGGLEHFAIYAITPSGAFTLFLLIVLSGMWRLIAFADAVLVARHDAGSIDRAGSFLAGILVAVILVTHGGLGWVAFAGYDASSKIFDVSGDTTPSAVPSDASDNQIEPDPSGSPGPTSSPNSSLTDGRLTFLLLGTDSAPGRTTMLTDSIMVVSVLPSTGAVAMISIPRDISYYPVYSGGIYKGKINEFLWYAGNHPTRFPEGAFGATMAEIGFIVGVPIDYYAVLNLGGFRTLIDTIGGVTVNNFQAINDPKYEWLDGTFGLTMPAGVQTLNGRLALAFARSRQGIGDSDFTRARRQQILLLALREKLISPDTLVKLPALLQVAGQTVRTNIPADTVGNLVDLAKGVDKSAIQQVVLEPPYSFHPPSSATGGTYILQLVPDQLYAMSIKVFGSDSRYFTK
jgi:LCP family protein required for cell wall assembly